MHASAMAAQLMTPVCTDALKFHNPLLHSFSSRGSWSSSANGSTSWSLIVRSGGRKRRGCGRIKVAIDGSASTDAIADDYYAVLGLLPDATPEQIKKAYYNCMKACHPDLSGNDPETTNFCMFINEVYAVLSDPVQRMVYDEIHGYALSAINPFLDDSSPKDLAFVDEFSCIGCKNCANVAPDVFGIEEDFGRARVYSQCGNPELVQQAIESCPVDCIHWTSAAQLSLLEDEMRRVERVNVALMLSGMGSGSMDVFRMASSRWEKRQAKVLEQAKIRMMKEKGSAKTEAYWSNLWGNPKEYQNSEEEVKERARRAAEAARRWREYSRRGVDKPPTFKLPKATSGKEN
ncbi:chaperone protein dnaJ C76, chloroplastic-like [Pistacia vera]|uniref:chaperone protein dnaJ C76, chloroplastic-like n=1 Tax=Pistacia vera TaxID=55513 RepID=UPI001262AE9A|nr:chaperone protein dnaJ C76, chloroplastic-like [Pistacia vera]